MVSGTGGMQGMMYTRGNPKVYNDWAKSGNDGWRYEDVLPYFIKAEKNKNPELVEERYHGTEGPLVVQHFPYRPPLCEAIVAAGNELGYRTGDLNGENQTGIAVAQMMVENGMRASTSRMYLRKAGARDNLDVLINSHVTQVLIDKKTNLATGVEILQKNGVKRAARAKREVILSGGAIGSPQILLLSGVGPSEDLEELGIEVVQDLPVGRNLHNHVSASVGFYINDTSYETLTTSVLQEYLNTHKGPLSATGITQTTAFLLSRYANDGVPDLQVFFDGYMATCSRTGFGEECTDGGFGECGRRYITARPTNILPKSRGYLKLRSTNPKDHPLIFPNYFSATRDAEVLADGMKFVVRLTETESLQGWGAELDKTPAGGCEGPPFGSDEYWQCVIRRHTGPENHQAGSCKMGPAGDPTAVVDPQLRVHGVRNIRVIDASIFPYVPNSNTIAGVVMVAEKGSDMIKDTWQSSEKADNSCHEFGISEQCDMNSKPKSSRSLLHQ
jgi:choline dehydrogenase